MKVGNHYDYGAEELAIVALVVVANVVVVIVAVDG